MKNILIPTDFSETAENAFHFARDLFASSEVKFTLAHFFMSALVTDMGQPPVGDYIEAWQQAAEQQLAEFVRKNCPDASNMVQIVAPGFAAEEIVRLSDSPAVDMVVMGATGEKGWLEKIFGSVSLHVARHGRCPVLLVPDGVRFTGFENVMYASDYDDEDETLVRRIDKIMALSDAKVHLVHVTEDPAAVYAEQTFEINHLFKKEFPHTSFRIARIKSNDVPYALKNYASRRHIDLMVMATRERGFIGALLHESMTKAVAFNTRTPLMVLHAEA